MTATFAAAEARTVQSAMRRLANADATIGAAIVPVIFDSGYQTGLAGAMESTGPTVVGATADLAAAVEGTAVTINSVAYKVVDNQPDGTGMTTLVLERAA